MNRSRQFLKLSRPPEEVMRHTNPKRKRGPRELPRLRFLKLHFLCLRPLAPTAIALKGIYWQCVAAMGVGERVRA